MTIEERFPRNQKIWEKPCPLRNKILRPHVTQRAETCPRPRSWLARLQLQLLDWQIRQRPPPTESRKHGKPSRPRSHTLAGNSSTHIQRKGTQGGTTWSQLERTSHRPDPLPHPVTGWRWLCHPARPTALPGAALGTERCSLRLGASRLLGEAELSVK